MTHVNTAAQNRKWHVWTQQHKHVSDVNPTTRITGLNMWIQQHTTQTETCECNSANHSPSAQTRHACESNGMGHKLKHVNLAAQKTNWIIRELQFRLNMYLNLSNTWVGWITKGFSCFTLCFVLLDLRILLCVLCCWFTCFTFCAAGFSCFTLCFVLLD